MLNIILQFLWARTLIKSFPRNENRRINFRIRPTKDKKGGML